MLIIICRCWPLIHPFIYLFWRHVCAHLDSLWNLKQRGKIPSFWGTLNSVRDQPHLQMVCVWWKTSVHTRAEMHSKAHVHRRKHRHAHMHAHPLPLFYLLLLSLSLRVALEYLRCVIRHWFPSEPEGKKKYLTERYIKRGHSEFLTFFAQLLQNE